MNDVLAGYYFGVDVLGRALFYVAAVVAVIALVDWLIRTRRINPFSSVGQYFRRVVDPLMMPVERRIVNAGGQPASAPWWTLVFVVVGGYLLLWALRFLGGLLEQLAFGFTSPGAFAVLLLGWIVALIRIALLVRVVSSWFQVSAWSKWVRWAYVLTEWFLAPLRRVIPTFGPLDLTPLVAFLL